MEDHELVARLETARFILGQPAIREGGVVLYRINDVFMFEEDAVDLANGNATIEQIIKRNNEKCFPQLPPRKSVSGRHKPQSARTIRTKAGLRAKRSKKHF